MTLTKLIKASTMGGVMLLGLNLLSQPAQAISFGFSFANRTGDAPRGADQLITGTIDGLVEGNNSGTGVTATVLSTPTGQFFGKLFYSGLSSIKNGPTPAFVVSNGNIVFANAKFVNYGLLEFSPYFSPYKNVNGHNPYGGSKLVVGVSTPFSDDTQAATFTATAVPWETDALPVIGSTVLFGLGLWARNKFAKPLQK